VTPLQQMPRRAHPDDACTQYNDSHGPLLKKVEKLGRSMGKTAVLVKRN
jgi:hypothetical protein